MRTEKEIKRLIAEFKPPIKQAKTVLNEMKCKLHNYQGKGKDEAEARLDTLGNLVTHCVAMQTEMNDIEEQYYAAIFDVAYYKSRLAKAELEIKVSKF